MYSIVKESVMKFSVFSILLSTVNYYFCYYFSHSKQCCFHASSKQRGNGKCIGFVCEWEETMKRVSFPLHSMFTHALSFSLLLFQKFLLSQILLITCNNRMILYPFPICTCVSVCVRVCSSVKFKLIFFLADIKRSSHNQPPLPKQSNNNNRLRDDRQRSMGLFCFFLHRQSAMAKEPSTRR